MTFASLGLHHLLLKSVAAAGYTEPTPVQAQAIPTALAGADLLVSSQTGSGKTAAFMLPCLHRLADTPPARRPRVLVLVPTRELAAQVTRAADTYGRELSELRYASIVGGTPVYRETRMLRERVDLIIATPGRLIDHLNRRSIDLSQVEVLVLDEADRMLDMGFIGDIEAIIARVPTQRQMLLYSATLEGVVGNLATRVTRDAQRIQITSAPAQRNRIGQTALFADDMRYKSRLLDSLLRDVKVTQALVFTATKRAADDLSQQQG